MYVPNDAVHRESVEANNMGMMISCVDHHGGPVQNAVPEHESSKFETRVEAVVKDTARHVETEAARCGVKTEVVDWILTVPGSSTQAEGEHHLLHRRCPRHRKHTRRRAELSMFATPDLYEAQNLGAVINNYGGVVQSAVPGLVDLKLRHEVEAEALDVRRDKAKVDQSAGILGAKEIERLRYVAGQAAGSQARPRSAILTPAGLDADVAVKMGEKEAALAGMKTGVVDWIQTVSWFPVSDASFATWLHDGKVLCALVNAIRPNESTLALKQMENITYFMDAARDMECQNPPCAGRLTRARR